MSNHRLGRAVIECGRGGWSKFGRKLRARSARRWKLVDGEYEPGPRRGEGPSLSDNLNPLERWLKRQVGRSWDKTYSEFCKREDKRTLRGDHIHRHLKEMVVGSGHREYFFLYNPRFYPPCYLLHGSYGFWVDPHGILRYHGPRDHDPIPLKARPIQGHHEENYYYTRASGHCCIEMERTWARWDREDRGRK